MKSLLRSRTDHNFAATTPGRTAARTYLVTTILIALVWLLVQPYVAAQDGSTGSSAADHGGGSLIISLVIVFLLILLSGVFAMAEMALVSVRRTRIEQLREEGNRSARMVAQLLSEPTRMLSTIQVGVTLIALFSAGAAAESAVVPFARFLQRSLPDTIVANLAHKIAFIVVVGGVSLVTLVVGEISPKSIAIRHAEWIALRLAYLVRFLQIIAAPIVWLVESISGVLVKPFGVHAGFHHSALSEDELRILVEQSEEHGVIETDEKEMIHSIFEFADTVVRRVMTPRLDVTAIEADAPLDELVRIVTESGHSRVPVFDDELDNIVGIVHVKDAISYLAGPDKPVTVRELMREAYFIPENKRVDDLLKELQHTKTQMAIVRDEYGTVTGVVTIEDLLEEIVGEIQDEYDVEEGPLVTQVDEHSCLVDGRMSLADFNARMGVELPMEETDTLGGFVFGLLGHQPVEGECAEWDGIEFEVNATDGRRIQRVRVIRQPAPPEESGPGAEDARTGRSNGQGGQTDVGSTDRPGDIRAGI